MKIVLFGKTGQVGSELFPRLAHLGEVVPFSRSEADLSDPSRLNAILSRHSPDVIVNAAAYTHVDDAETHRDTAFALNARAPEIMAAWAKAHQALLVHYSTDYIFDGSGNCPYSEDDSPKPLNIYGESKLAGEEAIRAVGSAHIIFRTSWVYGVQGKNFVATMLRLANERKEIRVVYDQIGAPTSASVIAEGTVQVLSRLKAPIQETFHLTCQGETSWYGFAEKIFELAKTKKRLTQLPTLIPVSTDEYLSKTKRPLNSRLSNDKIQRTFEYFAPLWTDALAERFQHETDRIDR